MNAWLGCLFIAAAFVAPMHLSKRDLPRNHPAAIRQRGLTTAAACCVTWLPLFLTLSERHPVRCG
jgi:hypothetical protein